jgi:hypothetical protein
MVNKFYISHECTVVETLGITVRVFVLDAVKKIKGGSLRFIEILSTKHFTKVRTLVIRKCANRERQ